VLSAVGADEEAAYIVVGHSHSDHTMDLGPMARMTGANIIGHRTTCLQARAQGIPTERCTAVEGGEVLTLLPGLGVRVIRWAHSGDPANRLGRFLQAPKELIDLPFVDRETGAMYPGPMGAFPNGGGARAYLFSYAAPEGPIRWLASDTGNPFTFDGVVGIPPDYLADVGLGLGMLDLSIAQGSPRDWLASGLAADGSNEVDLWLAYGGRVDHIRQVHEYLLPAAVIPHHWGGLFGDYASGVSRPYRNVDVARYLDSAGVAFMPQGQYLERYRLTAAGVERVANDAVRAAIGLPGAPSADGPGG
jgi:L-ascorbate metabolism protein UlaG (beta-lactamase superfamily)